jgi:Type VI secretion system effector, Hcp
VTAVTVSTDDHAASFSDNKENNKMRISTLCVLSAALAAVSLFCGHVSAATLAVHTQAPKVNVHLPPPKVNVQSSSPKVSSPRVSDLHITKTVDKASPTLYKGVFNGKHIPKATISARRTGGSKTTYDDKKSGDEPTESMSIPFSEVKF